MNEYKDDKKKKDVSFLLIFYSTCLCNKVYALSTLQPFQGQIWSPRHRTVVGRWGSYQRTCSSNVFVLFPQSSKFANLKFSLISSARHFQSVECSNLRTGRELTVWERWEGSMQGPQTWASHWAGHCGWED